MCPCFQLRLKLLTCFCLRAEIEEIIGQGALIYAFQISEHIDQSALVLK